MRHAGIKTPIYFFTYVIYTCSDFYNTSSIWIDTRKSKRPQAILDNPVWLLWLIIANIPIHLIASYCNYDRYIIANSKANSACGRSYSREVPEYLHNRPPGFVMHCLKRLESAHGLRKRDIERTAEQSFVVNATFFIIFKWKKNLAGGCNMSTVKKITSVFNAHLHCVSVPWFAAHC